jgi:hypothetical protein
MLPTYTQVAVLILIEESNSTVYLVAQAQNPGAPVCKNLGRDKTTIFSKRPFLKY